VNTRPFVDGQSVISPFLGGVQNSETPRHKSWATANSTWGVSFEISRLKAWTSLLPRFSEKRPSSFELWALKQHSKMSPQVGLAVLSSCKISTSFVNFNVSYSSCWGYSLINTFKLKQKWKGTNLGRCVTAELTNSGIEISEVRSLPGLDIRDWPRRLWLFRPDLPAMEEATSS